MVLRQHPPILGEVALLTEGDGAVLITEPECMGGEVNKQFV